MRECGRRGEINLPHPSPFEAGRGCGCGAQPWRQRCAHAAPATSVRTHELGISSIWTRSGGGKLGSLNAADGGDHSPYCTGRAAWQGGGGRGMSTHWSAHRRVEGCMEGVTPPRRAAGWRVCGWVGGCGAGREGYDHRRCTRGRAPGPRRRRGRSRRSGCRGGRGAPGTTRPCRLRA